LQSHLKEAFSKVSDSKTCHPVDAGDVENFHVCQRWKREFEFLKSLGYDLLIAWWSQHTKGDDDIDELADLTKIELITPEEFLSWAEIAEENKSVDIKKPLAQCRATSSKDGQWQDKQEEIPSSSSQKPIKRQSSKTPLTESGTTQPLTDSTLPESSIRKGAESKSINLKQYIKPIEELPQVGFHIIRNSQDELLERFDALKTKRGQEWLKLREFTPDITIHSKYFDYDAKPDENLAINSGLGTGKSTFVNAKLLKDPDQGAVLGGYRNALNEQFCENGKKLNGQPWYQIQTDLKGTKDLAMIADSTSRIAGAVDSWGYFSPHYFDGKYAIFDEFGSVASHLNQSNTAVSLYRDVVKSRVCDALQNSKANCIADGNLRDFEVDYSEKLSGRKFTKILNTHKGNRGHIYLYNGSSKGRKATAEDVNNNLAKIEGEWISYDHKAEDYSKLHRVMMDLPIDIPLLILCDSQKKCQAWDKELTAKGRKVFRLDSTTSQTDLGKSFLKNPKKFILDENIDTVILSPSAESGISIEMADELEREIPGYFKYEFAFFFGVSLTDTQTQFLGRNRDPYTTKFVYAAPRSLPATTSLITNDDDSSDVFKTWLDTIQECASLSLQNIEEDQILQIAFEKIKKQLSDPHLQYQAKLLLKESFERDNSRHCLEYALREAGHKVTVVESKEDDLTDLIERCEQIDEERSIKIFESQELTPSEAKKLSPKLKKSEEERNQIKKAKVLEKLPGVQSKVAKFKGKIKALEEIKELEKSEQIRILEVAEKPYEEWQNSSQEIPKKGVTVIVEKPAFDPNFINKILHKDRLFIYRLESQYLLRNLDVAKLLQQEKWAKKLDLLTDPEKSDAASLPIAAYRSKYLEIHTLYEMGIEWFLQGNSWTDQTPEAIAFWEKGQSATIARRINTKHEDSPVAYTGKILNKYGFKTKSKQKSKDGVRYREYTIDTEDSLSQVTLECIEQRIQAKISGLEINWQKIIKNQVGVQAETKVGYTLEPAHLPPNNLYKASEQVCSLGGVENQAGVQATIQTGYTLKPAHLPPNNLYKASEQVCSVEGESNVAIEVAVEKNLTSSNVAIEVAVEKKVEPLAKAFESCDTVEVLAPETNITTELLAESLSTVESVDEFKEISEWFEPAEVLDAIAASNSLPLRSKLRGFYEALRGAIAYPWGNQSSSGFSFG
jgi:hypothetical protein